MSIKKSNSSVPKSEPIKYVNNNGVQAPLSEKGKSTDKFTFKAAYRQNVPTQNLNLTSVNAWLNYDVDNLYPQRLLTYLDSAVHSAIIETKKGYTAGDGMIWDTTNGGLNDFLENINYEYDVNELMLRTAYDLILFGGFSWQICWSKDGSRIVSITHQDFSKVRVSRPDAYGNTNGYYISANWKYATNGSTQYKPYQPVFIKKFDCHEKEVLEPTLLYYRTYTPLLEFYPVPDYNGIINDLITDRNITEFYKSFSENCFMPSVAIMMPEDPNEESKDNFARELGENFQGATQAGMPMIFYGSKDEEGGTVYPEIKAFDQLNNSNYFEYIQRETTQKIITGHKLTSPTLAGISGTGGLGGNGSEIATAITMFTNTVIKSYQKPLLQVLKKVLAINNLPTDVSFKAAMPINFIFSESVLSTILTTNEMRVATGYEPIEGGDVIVSQSSSQPQFSEQVPNDTYVGKVLDEDKKDFIESPKVKTLTDIINSNVSESDNILNK